ncbi:hypothetical protein [Acinetobacter oleivorans]
MSDETYSLNADEEKVIYTHCLLSLYRIYLILRNLSYSEYPQPDEGKDNHLIYEMFDDAAYQLRKFPSYFDPSREINVILKNWDRVLSEFFSPTSHIFNSNILKDEENFKTILKTTNEISDFFSKKPPIDKTVTSKSVFQRKIDPEFENIHIIYKNGLEQQQLKNEIGKAKVELKAVKSESLDLKQTISDFKETHTSFNAFVEKNYNDATKKIYDEIFNTENTLANEYRSYAVKVFGVVAFIACITFITPWWFGILHWTRTYKFEVAPVDTLFFVKSLFMLLLTAPGWYFARESAKHRQVAYKAKIISAELSALPYYIADLEVEKRHEMRMKMADKFFGQELYNDKKSDNSNVNEQTKATTEAIKTINALLGKANKPNENNNP